MTARRRRRLALSRSLLAWSSITWAACGGADSDSPPAGATADAGEGLGSDGAPAGATAFAVATDYQTTGVASTISIPGLDVAVDAVEGVASTDPVVRRLGDRLFIINRFGQDNVTVLDAASLRLVGQISTGPGSNPQDVAVIGETVFVAALAAPGVLVLDLARPDAGVVETIDLSDLDPGDGLPDCSTIAAVGDQVVAVCGILDDGDLSPRGPGVAALIDGSSHAVLDRAPLDQIRPFGMAQVAAGEPSLLVPTVADFAAPATGGCLERIALGGGTIESAGCLIDNASLGGFVSGLAPEPSGARVWMTVTTSFDPVDFGPYGDLISIPVGGGEMERLALPDDLRPMDLALCPTGHLVLSDATRGVRVLSAGAGSELTSGPLDIGLPPVSNGLACY